MMQSRFSGENGSTSGPLSKTYLTPKPRAPIYLRASLSSMPRYSMLLLARSIQATRLAKPPMVIAYSPWIFETVAEREVKGNPLLDRTTRRLSRQQMRHSLPPLTELSAQCKRAYIGNDIMISMVWLSVKPTMIMVAGFEAAAWAVHRRTRGRETFRASAVSVLVDGFSVATWYRVIDASCSLVNGTNESPHPYTLSHPCSPPPCRVRRMADRFSHCVQGASAVSCTIGVLPRHAMCASRSN